MALQPRLSDLVGTPKDSFFVTWLILYFRRETASLEDGVLLAAIHLRNHGNTRRSQDGYIISLSVIIKCNLNKAKSNIRKCPLYCSLLSIAITQDKLSLVMRKPAFCICENKDADQLRGNHEADQRLCFRYTDSTIPLLPKSEISSL